MTALSPSQSSEDRLRRPKGILKNSSSYTTPHQINTAAPYLDTSSTGFQDEDAIAPSPIGDSPSYARRPSLARDVSEKELTFQNTMANAGPRRNSSGTRRSSTSGSRRHSSAITEPMELDDGPRLKWDEANLYLTEQDRGDKMKITEPKTPYAKHYDPAEDEQEMASINASELLVDEFDSLKGQTPGSVGPSGDAKNPSGKGKKMDQIPDLDLGEPEDSTGLQHVMSEGEKRVVVGDSGAGERLRDEVEEEDMTAEERIKHREFEKRRKMHYDMHNVKDVLGTREDLDDDDEDDEMEDVENQQAPPLPTRS